ncbi:MAG TPA: N-6 DNA methylase [Ktedonobacteraceae bacterium]|nr:N-6 DNA methylase [Ktedonobacteraceae bacterium]
MSNIDLKEILLEELDYTEVSGLKSTDLWPNGRPIPFVESAYFVQDVPVAYFSQLSDADPDRLWELYRCVWSQSKVPLLYVILPQEIRIYNGYAQPAKSPEELSGSDRLLQNLQQLVSVETARQEIRSKLSDYRRLYLETGAFWSTFDGQRIKRENRADQQLLDAMDQVRRHLLKDETLSDSVAYALLGRSIFIRYLEDRGILNSEWILRLTGGQADNYLATLENIDITYRLFEGLSKRFNGDLFPVDEEGKERQKVKQKHLNYLGDFLQGHNLDTGQRSFWPYDFTYIPIELISGIYDTFLSKATREELGAYYTPLSLVDFVVEETLPLDKAHPGMTVLDPACGSGVFLVRAYQQLVEAWKREHNKIPMAKHLSEVLKQSIFGVDIQLNAVRIAAFSLYLALLDYLTNEEIAEESFRFPSMKDTNLINANFFSSKIDVEFSGKKFDRVIGNPPWGRGTLKGEALQWVEEHDYPTGDKQIVQAFLWRAPEFCAIDGEIALLAPTKSTILVTMNTHERFRQRFFDEYNVRAVVNFSALRHELFVDSVSPTVTIFYRPQLPSEQSKVVYGVPKPSSLSQRLGAIVLDTTEVKFLEREELSGYPELWKVALWGNPRDAAFIRRLQSFPALQQQAKQLGWGKILEGFFEGNQEKEALWLQGMPFLDVNKFKPYVVETHGTVQERLFERPRSPVMYNGPLALIRRSTCEAAFFSTGKVAYSQKITGVPGQPGQENLLKWLVAYINSSLARYYHFLTSTSWAVERGTILHEEYKRMPFLVPDKDDPRLKAVLDYFDQIAALHQQRDILLSGGYEDDLRKLKDGIDDLVFDLYDLSRIERQLVQDMVEYGIEFFYWSERKQRKLNDSKFNTIKNPGTQMLMEYAENFVDTVTALLRYQNQTLNAAIFQDDAPLSVVGFELASLSEAREVKLFEESQILQDTLRKLDRLLLEKHTPTLYTRRHIRIYDDPWLYLVRPSERRFWTRSQARADADSFIMEMLNRSRTEVGVSD